MDKVISEVKGIINMFLTDCKRYLFGSISKGANQPNSEYYFAIKSPVKIEFNLFLKVTSLLEEINTLYSINLVDLDRVNKEFQNKVNLVDIYNDLRI